MTTEEIITLMDVKKASTVQGNNGPQWELTVTWPWTVGQNTDRTWLDKDKYPDEPDAGSYKVAANHRSVKNKREGGQHDGSKPWMWNWTVTRFLGPDAVLQDGGQPQTAAAAPQHAGTGTPEKRETGASTPATWVDQRDPTRASIERQVALKAAVELAGYNITMGKAIGARDIMAVATLFDRWLGRAFNVEAEPETEPE